MRKTRVSKSGALAFCQESRSRVRKKPVGCQSWVEKRTEEAASGRGEDDRWAITHRKAVAEF